MNGFRIFCKLIAKTMLKAIDFTDVLEVYRRNEKPEILGIATSSSMRRQLMPVLSRNEKPEILGIATTARHFFECKVNFVGMKSPK